MTGPAFRLVETQTTDEGWRCRVQALDPNPSCEGHFPEQPIVPGVAQLGLAVDLIREVTGTPHRLAAIRSLKLRRLVRPGEAFDVRLSRPTADGALRFEMTCDGERVSQGAFAVTPKVARG
jgi:3-hydroxymyristoyl/3-hydroxydecanoyl-(acyl carrier protein) dehydratase